MKAIIDNNKMKTTIEETIKNEPTFKIECDGKSVSAWRKVINGVGGYVLQWSGFAPGRVAPRCERETSPYFDKVTKKEIESLFNESIEG